MVHFIATKVSIESLLYEIYGRPNEDAENADNAQATTDPHLDEENAPPPARFERPPPVDAAAGGGGVLKAAGGGAGGVKDAGAGGGAAAAGGGGLKGLGAKEVGVKRKMQKSADGTGHAGCRPAC